MSAFSNSNFSAATPLFDTLSIGRSGTGLQATSAITGAAGLSEPVKADSLRESIAGGDGAAATCFQSYFTDCMDMHADPQTVAAYFDEHSVWFRRCAQPMRAEPLGKNSYALVIGKFGSFGYELEPKLGLDLLPQTDRVYRIETVAIPGYESLGYDIDFSAEMALVPGPQAEGRGAQGGAAQITHVQWKLDLAVQVQFPRFIQALPQSLIASTGDRVLRQVVKQFSKRLMRKVQDDFHTNHGIPFSS